jgi:hypothetical protein
MPSKGGMAPFGVQDRSAAEVAGSAALVQVMKAWDELTDLEFLTWNVAAKLRRVKGVNYFKLALGARLC